MSKHGFALGKAIEHSFMYGNDRIEARSSISTGEEVTLALIALILILLETRSFLLHDFAWGGSIVRSVLDPRGIASASEQASHKCLSD